MNRKPLVCCIAAYPGFGIAIRLDTRCTLKTVLCKCPGPLVIAHQGGDGIWPGDTLYAFEKAVEIGADVLEMDAHITKDGQIVLMHDEEVDRTTDAHRTHRRNDSRRAQSNSTQHINGPTMMARHSLIADRELKCHRWRKLFQKFPQMRYVIEIKLTQNPIDKPFAI